MQMMMSIFMYAKAWLCRRRRGAGVFLPRNIREKSRGFLEIASILGLVRWMRVGGIIFNVRKTSILKLPKVDNSDKYVGLYVVGLGDQCSVGYTAEEVATLLESEKFTDVHVYKIYRAQPDGQMGQN